MLKYIILVLSSSCININDGDLEDVREAIESVPKLRFVNKTGKLIHTIPFLTYSKAKILLSNLALL